MILGTTNSKFVSGITTVQLYNSQLNTDFSIPDEEMYTDILTGNRDFIKLNDYSYFRVLVFLFKYANAATQFNTFYAYNHATVDEFYPHADGDAITDRFGVSVQYYIKSITPFYLNHPDIPSGCVFEFMSTKYTEIVASKKVLYTESGIPLITEDGNEIFIE